MEIVLQESSGQTLAWHQLQMSLQSPFNPVLGFGVTLGSASACRCAVVRAGLSESAASVLVEAVSAHWGLQAFQISLLILSKKRDFLEKLRWSSNVCQLVSPLIMDSFSLCIHAGTVWLRFEACE